MSKMETQTALTNSFGYNVKWSIKDFLNITFCKGDWIESPSFWVNHAEWYIVIYPFRSIRNEEYISLYLTRKSHLGTNNVTYTFSIETSNKILAKKASVKFKGNVSLGIKDFMLRSELFKNEVTAPLDSTVIVTCTIECLNLFGEKSQTTQTLNDYTIVETLKNRFEDMLISKDFSDIQINVKGRKFNVHKCVIAARSSVFHSMLKHEMTESLSGIIDIEDCEPDSFEDFLLYIYAGKLDKVTSTTAIGLYKIAEKYNVQDLKEHCIKRMLFTGLVLDNFCDVLDLAVTYRETELLQSATDFFIEKEDKIFDSEKWRSFLFEKTSIAHEFLKKTAKRRLNY